MLKIVVIAFTATLLCIWFVLPYILRRYQTAALRLKCKNSHTIVLTYDDGPGADLTRKLLALLKAYDVRASFFMLGKKITADLEVPHMLVQAGHEIGSHSFQHLNAWKRSPLAVYRDINRGPAIPIGSLLSIHASRSGGNSNNNMINPQAHR